MLGDYLYKIFDDVSINDADYNSSVLKTELFVNDLKSVLNEINQIKIFGSFTRKTGLSNKIDKTSDIDIFLINSHEEYSRRIKEYRKENEGVFDDFWLNLLFNKLQRNKLFSPDFIGLDTPSINLTYKEINFQLTPAWEIRSDSYLFFRRITKWEIENPDLSEPYAGAGVSNAESDEAMFHTNPFYLTELSREFQEVCGDAWRMLIVILKYWRYVHKVPLTSYMIEENAFNSLRNIKVFRECSNLFELLKTFLDNDTLFHSELFNRFQEFFDLKEACKLASDYLEANKLKESFTTIAQVIPPKTLLHLFPCNESPH